MLMESVLTIKVKKEERYILVEGVSIKDDKFLLI